MKVAHLSEPAEERVIFRDGLGVREWRDTGAGERVEWFHLDSRFAGVEMPLRDRVTRLAKLQHVKFARILSMEPARKGAGPVLVSSHVTGTRFSEVLDMAAHGLVTVEPATAVQITREVIGALVVLHDSRNVTHGALAPERLVLTASGRVVVAEHALAAALERLNLPRHQLWRDWRIATPPTPGPVRFDVRTDLAQLGLLALAALLGRAIDEEEYPHRLRGLLPLAQDKLARSPLGAIASDLVTWLERLVPVESRRAFTTVKEAQQAFESFVSARATSMIIAPARVKGLMSAVAALSTSTASANTAARPVDLAASATGGSAARPSDPPLSKDAPLTDGTSVTAAEAPDVADEIDIDALLRLEAELEGGETSAVPSATGRAPASLPPADPALESAGSRDVPAVAPEEVQAAASSALEALEHERVDLERQFAALVAAVAPASPLDDAPAVRLRPETPDTVDSPLVDPLVRWSSMPASDLPETPRTREEDRAPSEAVTSAAEGESAPELPAFSFEPLVIAVPDADAPAAALDHVPTEWWREALPWRDEPAAPLGEPPADVTTPREPVLTAEASVVESVVEPFVEEAPVAAPGPLTADSIASEELESADESAITPIDAQSAASPEDIQAVIGETPVVLGADEPEDAVTSDELALSASAPEFSDVDAVASDFVGVMLSEQDAYDASAGSAIPLDQSAGDVIEAVADVVTDTGLVQTVSDAVAEVPGVVDTAPLEVENGEAPGSLIADAPSRSEQPLASQAETVEQPAVFTGQVQLTAAPEAVDAEPAAVETTAVDASPMVDVLTPLEQMAAWHTDAVDQPPMLDSSRKDGDAPTAAGAEPLVAEVELVAGDGASVIAVMSPVEQVDEAPAETANEPSVVDGPASLTRPSDETFLTVADAVAVAEPSVIVPASLAWTAIEDPPSCVSDTASDVAADLGRREDVATEPLAESSADEPTSVERDEVEPPVRGSLFGAFADLRLQVDEADPTTTEDEPSLRPTFAFLQVDTTPPTAVASLLARHDEVPPVQESSWRAAFEADVSTDTSIIVDTVEAPVEADEITAAVADSLEMCADVAAPVAVDPAQTPPPAPESLPVPEAAPVAAPTPEPATTPAPTRTFDVEPELVPEVVIVDGGDDADAFDTLTPELPSIPIDVAIPAVAGDNADDDAVAEEEAAESHDDSALAIAPAITAGRKKRRRTRRRKPSVAMPPVPAVVADAASVTAAVPTSSVLSVAPPPSSLAATAPVVRDEPAAVSEETPLGGRRSLLEREVPTWTPPADLGAVARAAASRAIAVPASDSTSTSDEWGRDTAPSAVVAAGEPALPSVESPADAAAIVVATTRPPRQAMPVPVEPPRQEETIRAVGMPDLEELGLSSGRGSVTSMSEALAAHAPTRHSAEPRPIAVPTGAHDSRGGWNWRRLVAASVLIALFNGAAFAAWWWVQPGAHGTLVVQTAQPGIEVLLDGKVLGKTPFRDQVAPGRHKLTLRQGASVREMPVEISLGVVTTQSLDWPAADASARGNLQVSSTPAGAEILINGKSLGKAPLLLEDLPAGNLEMTLRSDAGTVDVTATVIAGETTPFEVPIFAGWVIVDAPIELNIILRGSRIGANTDGQILLSPGRHQLMAVNEALGFRKPFAVLIEPGEVRRVAVTVPPAPLQVQDESGSEVFVDGERVGTLPGSLRIPLGTHDVLVRRPDQTERRQTVTVRAGETVSM